MTPPSDISLVIVLYHPGEDEMARHRRLAALYQGVVVDNSDNPCIEGDTLGRMHYVCNRQNLGIAEAQNIGIRWIMENTGCKYIVFLDQDSQIADSYPQQIADEYARLAAAMPLATLGPTVIDRATRVAYVSAFHKDNAQAGGFVPRREIISSGSVIPSDILREVGLMDARLFIDYVDFEWCWRAKSRGYLSGITQHVTISHQVGRRSVRLLGKTIILSAPFRYYYQWRNLLALRRLPYTPSVWARKKMKRKAAEMILLLAIAKDGGQMLWQSLRGIHAGMKFRLKE